MVNREHKPYPKSKRASFYSPRVAGRAFPDGEISGRNRVISDVTLAKNAVLQRFLRLSSRKRRPVPGTVTVLDGALSLTCDDTANELVVRRGLRTVRHPHTFWYGRTHAPFWGDDVEIDLNTDATHPTAADLRRVDRILSPRACMRDDIVSAICRYYAQLLADGANLDRNIGPDTLTPEYILTTVDHPSVDPNPISVPQTGNISFLMSFSCTLDEEHGVDVHVVDWRVRDVGCLI